MTKRPISNIPEPAAIVDIRVPFWRIVSIMVTWSVAAIPAMILLSLAGFAVTVFLSMIAAALGFGFMPSR